LISEEVSPFDPMYTTMSEDHTEKGEMTIPSDESLDSKLDRNLKMSSENW